MLKNPTETKRGTKGKRDYQRCAKFCWRVTVLYLVTKFPLCSEATKFPLWSLLFLKGRRNLTLHPIELSFLQAATCHNHKLKDLLMASTFHIRRQVLHVVHVNPANMPLRGFVQKHLSDVPGSVDLGCLLKMIQAERNEEINFKIVWWSQLKKRRIISIATTLTRKMTYSKYFCKKDRIVYRHANYIIHGCACLKISQNRPTKSHGFIGTFDLGDTPVHDLGRGCMTSWKNTSDDWCGSACGHSKTDCDVSYRLCVCKRHDWEVSYILLYGQPSPKRMMVQLRLNHMSLCKIWNMWEPSLALETPSVITHPKTNMERKHTPLEKDLQITNLWVQNVSI